MLWRIFPRKLREPAVQLGGLTGSAAAWAARRLSWEKLR
jgi:hypothetical protein